ncbi:MAG: universal stress protein [Thermodesulfobacteriota bacterium]|nr:MAG: universal stress protein [Thermodesulfobacteriota bacterium]
MKIMVAHDGSDNAQKALDKTLELFKPLNPEIILIMVVEGPRDASMENEPIFEREKSKCHDFLHKTAEKVVDQGFEVDAILAVGDPRRMITEATNTKSPDFLVVAKRGEGIVERMVLGSTSAFLIRHAKCPVLVVH